MSSWRDFCPSPSRVLTAPLLALALAVGLVSAAPTASAGAASAAWGFEHDPVGATPSGCSTPVGKGPALVSGTRAHTGARSLLVQDDSSTAQTLVTCAASVAPGADLRFALYPDRLTNGAIFSLLGSFQGKPAVNVPVFHFLVRPDGSLSWYDGLDWTQIGAAGTIGVGRWNTVAVQVPSDDSRANVYAGQRDTQGAVDRRAYVGSAGPVGVSPVAAVTGWQVASAGTATTGDALYVDDVSLTDGRHITPVPRDPAVRVGDSVTVDETATGLMQMPNTAVSIPGPGTRSEILVAYPVHGDDSHATGTALRSSTDGGRTWQPADDRNPFPDAQSFYLSRLADGDLLAVSYHTFMVEGTGDTTAEVPTAVSHDGGHTWQYRNGVMTAPQTMRPISTATDRPGSRLGGFVLVHRVTEDPDGTLYQSGYGYYLGDRKYRQIVIASTDGGVNWTVRSTVAVNPDLSNSARYEGFCEAAITRVADGSLLAVMRTGSYQPMYEARSTDNGYTWSTPTMVMDGPRGIPVVGIFPELNLMGNGALALWIGRPGQSVLVSPDGSGRSWTSPVSVDYLNSGNGTLVPLGRNEILTFGDRGADWTPNTPATKGIWARPVFISPRNDLG